MKLNKIIIKNFRSYYGENCFELSDGLTLVRDSREIGLKL